jgi:Gpi18-like mannosyltransferase
MNVWFKTGLWLNNGINIYLPADHLGYPPLWALWCGFAYKLFTLLAYNIEAWRFIIKLPMILAHFVLAYVLGSFVSKHFNTKTGQKILVISLLWSFFIYIGALWGQINVISALLTFLAFYGVSKGKYKTGALALGLAITLKIFPLVVLPAFFIYWLKNSGFKKSVLYAVFACLIPIVFTVLIFTIFQWDILYFLKTIFYWAPVYDSEPTQMQGGCMNIWSFLGIIGVSIAKIWILRFIWIPVLAISSIYWLKKRKMNVVDLSLAIIFFYILFMVTYAWISEQTFIDLLPFTLLQVLAFQPKRLHLYVLSGVQLIIFAFSITNGGLLIFQPLIEKFAPTIFSSLNPSSPGLNLLYWNARGVLGLIVSLSLILLLILLMRPDKKEILSKNLSDA